MITRITAEFDEPEYAEICLGRIREKVKDIYSANMIYNRKSDKAEKMSNGTLYTIIPTAVTTHNYMTALMEYPSSADSIPEPQRNRRTTVYIICDSENVSKVRAVLHSFGATGIKN